MNYEFIKKKYLLIILFFLQIIINPNLNFFLQNSLALAPEERLQDENQEQLAREIFLQVRCLICSGQVIESSDNEFAHSMRQLIRNKISEGQTRQQIEQYLIKKYGSDIMIKPDYKTKSGIIIWLLPIILIIISSITMIIILTKNKSTKIKE